MGLLKDFTYHTPITPAQVRELLAALKEPFVLGGGTFSLSFLKKSAHYPADIIGLKKVSGFRGIRDSKSNIVIGAMTTMSEIAQTDVVQKYLLSLTQACAQMGTTPIRNMATIGGNIASRFFWVDLPAVLISLDATLTYMTEKDEESVSIDDFLHHKPAQKYVVTKITLPKKNLTSFYFRHTKTMEVDTPSLALAFSAVVDQACLRDVKFVVNTSVSFPVVLKETQDVCEGIPRDKISSDRVKEALMKDLEKTKLDTFAGNSLRADIESLAFQLKQGKR